MAVTRSVTRDIGRRGECNGKCVRTRHPPCRQFYRVILELCTSQTCDHVVMSLLHLCPCDDIRCPQFKQIECGCACCAHLLLPQDHAHAIRVVCPQRCQLFVCNNNSNHSESTKHNVFPACDLSNVEGHCRDCVYAFGDGFVASNCQDECPVCMTVNTMTKLRCNHTLCWNCWATICTTSDVVRCPLCRNPKWVM